MSKTIQDWTGLTGSGTLPVGVWYAGKRHRDFTLRVALAGDLITVQEMHPNGPFRLHAIEGFRLQLLTLGDIPPEALTTELLREQLTEIDLAALEAADAELGKKLASPSAPTLSAIGDASSTS